MNKAIEPLKPLRTWSHLANRRKRPSEYEIVSTNLHYRNSNTEAPFEQDPNTHMNKWYLKYCYNSPLKHEDWDAFRDPDEIIYRTYNMVQDGQETYVNGLFEQFAEREHDQLIDHEWLTTLVRLYTPCRYLFHTVQMASAYISQIAPASTITNCATFQTGDSFRWVTHTAYRTRELSKNHPEIGFGQNERSVWEDDPAWQGFRELMEKALVVWDWAEAFTVINLIAKPAIEEAVLKQLGAAARSQNDTLLGMLTQAQMRDAERHRRWATALVEMAIEQDGNKEILVEWINKWTPLADAAIDDFCSLGLGEDPTMAKDATKAFRMSLGLYT